MMVKEDCFVGTNLQKKKTAGVIPSGNIEHEDRPYYISRDGESDETND